MKAGHESAVRVVLVGLMGSGKTSVGRALAERAGWPFHDNDALLERATGMTARQILADHGEAALRRAEAEALVLGLGQPAPCVVAVAAGAITDAASRAALADALVVWLTARPETLVRRARGAAHRPWLDADPVGWMRTTAQERAPLYATVADVSIDTNGRSVGAVVDAIVDWLRGRGAYY